LSVSHSVRQLGRWQASY